MIPLLAPHLKELYSYDLRYYQGDVVSDIEDIKPGVVMIMGLGNGFIVELEIFKWKRE